MTEPPAAHRRAYAPGKGATVRRAERPALGPGLRSYSVGSNVKLIELMQYRRSVGVP